MASSLGSLGDVIGRMVAVDRRAAAGLTRSVAGRGRPAAAALVLSLLAAMTAVGWTYAADPVPTGCVITVTDTGPQPQLSTQDCSLTTPLIAPGSTGTFPVTVRNQAGFDLRAGLSIADMRSFENGCNRPENNVPDPSCGPGDDQGELDEYLELDLKGPAVTGGPVVSLWQGTMRELAIPGATATTTTVDPGTSTSLTVEWALPFATGNITQSDSVTWTWTITAAEIPGETPPPPPPPTPGPPPPPPEPPIIVPPAEIPVDIIRIEGPTRVETAVETSEEMFPVAGSAPTLLLARADIATEGVTGIPLAGQTGGAILLTQPDSLHPAVATELARALPDGATVILLGGVDALSEDVADAVEDLGLEVDRIAGANRADTATMIADRLGGGDLALVADGTDYRPVTVAGPAAASHEGVVLVSWGPNPAPETSAWLTANAGVEAIAIGSAAGTAHPSLDQVGDSQGPSISIAVAERFFDEPATIGLATNEVFADPLTGAAHIASFHGPLLLTAPDALDAGVADYVLDIRETLRTIYIYGGIAAITPAVEDDLIAVLTP